MNRTPVADWQKLSALYELADALDPATLADWLAQLRAQHHPLLTQLEQMLAARSDIQHNDFLGTLPRLPPPPAPTEPTAIEWREGNRIGPYRLLRRLGAGGMAEVWMAQRADGAFQRTVAIKLLFRHAGSSERDSFAQRFTRERDILASLNHPHIASLHDAGVTPAGQPWLALEYVEGDTLTAWCDAQQFGVTERVRLFRQVLLAVQHAHANLVIHRDLKPGNILVTAQGEVRLLDFGIAKLIEPEGGALADTELTRQAGRPLTLQYASPEQLTGQPLTTASDVYSLGVVLYELLCGERPYELKVKSAAQVEQAILDMEPRAPSRRTLADASAAARGTTTLALRKALASDLDAIVLRALAKQPAQRYGSVEALRIDLDHWLAGEPVDARVPSAAYRVGKFVLRHRLAVSLGVGAVLSLICVATVAVVMGLQAREDSARAGAARDFMLDLFKHADQEKARGADITARELLQTGRKELLTRLASQPRLQVELLEGIGTIQRDMGEYVGADSTFADAARVYAQLGMSRNAALAFLAQAEAAVRMGNVVLAQAAVQQARSMPTRSAADPELNARMREMQGWVAFLQGDTLHARDLFEQSRAQAVKAFGPHHVKVIDALRGQMYAERKLRHFDSALQLLDTLKTTASKTSGIDARMVPGLLKDRANLLLIAGRWSESLSQAVAALPQCIADLGPNHSECRELVFYKVSALLRLGMTSQAAQDLPSLWAIANDSKSPALGSDTLLLIVKLESTSGAQHAQGSAFDRVRSLVESDASSAMSPNLRSKALLTLVEARLRAGDGADVDRWLAMAMAAQRRDDGSLPPSFFAVVAESLRGVSLLQRGQGDQALEVLGVAQSSAATLFGPDDPVTKLVSLNAALALQALHRNEAALAIVKDSGRVLLGAVGADAPAYSRILRLQDDLQQSLAPERPAVRGVASTSPANGAGRSASFDFFN